MAAPLLASISARWAWELLGIQPIYHRCRLTHRYTIFTDLNAPPKSAQRVCRRRPNFGLLTPTPANPVNRTMAEDTPLSTIITATPLAPKHLLLYLSSFLPSQWGDRPLSDKCYFPIPGDLEHTMAFTQEKNTQRRQHLRMDRWPSAEVRQLGRGVLPRCCRGMSQRSTPTSP